MDEAEIPVRSIYLGPDHAGNLLEVIVLELDRRPALVIHAMKMRGTFDELLSPKHR
jgi:hypothetical protein